jgi:hypothetical protein
MAAAKFFPLALEAIEFQFPVSPLRVQEFPELVLTYNLPLVAPETAANIVPSALEAIQIQGRAAGVIPEVRVTHVAPESVLVYICPLNATAANFIPSALEAIYRQPADNGNPEVRLTHVLP